MSDGRGRRIALGTAIAFGVAVAVARAWRRALPAWVDEPQEEPPGDAPPAPAWVEPAVATPAWVEPVVATPAVPPAARPSPPRASKPRRRTVLVMFAVVLLLGALVGASLGLRSNARGLTSFQGATGPLTATSTISASARRGPFCVTQRSGWQSEWVTSGFAGTPPALVLTNFRFGAAPTAWGLFDPRLHWAPGDVMIAVADWTQVAKGSIRSGFRPGPLRVGRADLVSYGSSHVRVGHRQVRFHGRLLALFVEARPPTAAVFTAANSLLSGVRICSP
jgi:hypothetical protein